MKKLIYTLILILIFSIFLSSCANLNNDNDTLSSTLSKTETSNSTQSENSTPLSASKPTAPFGYNNLNKTQQNLYNLLVSGGITEEQPFNFTGDEDVVNKYLAALTLYQMNVNRVSAWNTKHYHIAYDEETITRPVAIVEIEGFDNRGNYGNMLKLFNEKTEEYLLLLPDKKADDYTKVKAIAELLSKNVSYNFAAYPYSGIEPSNNKEKDIARYASQDYGAIVNGSAICTGYAAAFQYLCGLLDVYSIYVEGFITTNDIGHAWNMVYIDGAYYHVDVTFMSGEDTFDETGFLMSDEEISIDRYGIYYGDQTGWSFDPYLADLFKLPVADKKHVSR